MTIISTLPYNIQNGQPVDATPLMADLNQIVLNVNLNAADLNAINTFSSPQVIPAAILPTQVVNLSQAQSLVDLAHPIGSLIDYAGTGLPASYLDCNGALVSRSLYAPLFAVLGTTWGAGDGVTTFGVPDLRRRTTMNAGGSASAYIGNTVGSLGGEESHALSVGELASHGHVMNDPGHNHGVSDPSHNHALNDPGHAHGISDPGHAHGIPSNYMSNNLTGGAFNPVGAQAYGVGGATAAAATGIGIYAALTGAYNSASVTSISVVGAYTGVNTQATGSSAGHNTVQPTAVVRKLIRFQ